MKLHACTIKTKQMKRSTSHSTKFELWSGYLLYGSLCFCQTPCPVSLPVFPTAPSRFPGLFAEGSLVPCVTGIGQCVMVTTFHKWWILLFKSLHFCKRWGWGNKQRGRNVSRCSACGKRTTGTGGLECLGKGGAGHWSWRLLGFGLMQYCCDLQKHKPNMVLSTPVNFLQILCSFLGPLLQKTHRGAGVRWEETASSCSREGLDWIPWNISSMKGLSCSGNGGVPVPGGVQKS